MAAIFYDYPSNMQTEQSNANSKIVSDRSLRTSVSAGSYSLATGGRTTNAFFAVTDGATSVNTFTASTENTNENFYLESFGGLQYTLHHFTASTSDFSLAVVGGTIYRCIVMNRIHTIPIDQFFSGVEPTRSDPTEVIHESSRGNFSKARHSQSNRKRRIQYEATFVEEDMFSAFNNIVQRYDRFTLARNTEVRYSDVFPCFVEGDISEPYSGWDFNAGVDINFVVQEM